MNILNILAILFALLGIYIFIRGLWVHGKCMQWIHLVYDFTTYKIEHGTFYIDSLSYYDALYTHNKMMFRPFSWNMDKMVEDKEKYEEVRQWHLNSYKD